MNGRRYCGSDENRGSPPGGRQAADTGIHLERSVPMGQGRLWIVAVLLPLLAFMALHPMTAHAQSPVTNTASVTSDENESTIADNGDAACVLMDGSGTIALGKVTITSDESDATVADNSSANCVALVAANTAPTITVASAISVAENQTAVITVTAIDDDSDPLTYTISGGDDAAAFSIDANTGLLTFNSAPDFENAGDANTDNDYLVQVMVSDGNGGTDLLLLTVTVTDAAEDITPPTPVISAPANHDGGSAFIITVDFGESVTGFDVSDVTVANGTANSVSGGPQNYAVQITPDGSNNDITIDIAAAAAQDGASNDSTAATQQTVTYSTATSLVTVPTAVTGTEDSAIGLGLTVDPSLINGGAQLNILGTEAGFRAAADGSAPTNFTIPAGTTSVRISGFGTGGIGASDNRDENHQTSNMIVNLAENTYAGHIFHVIGNSTVNNDNYTFSNVTLGQPSTSGTLTGDNDNGHNTITVSVSSNVLSIVESQATLDQAYLVEFLTNSGSSANLLGSTGSFMNASTVSTTLTLPASSNFVALSILTGRGGSSAAHEERGSGRIIVDLESGMASGAFYATIGNTENTMASYAFTGYDLTAGVPVLSSGAVITGDATAAAGILPNWTISNVGNELTLSRADNFPTMVTAQAYERVALSSGASALGTSSTTGIAVISANNVFSLTVPGNAQTGGMTLGVTDVSGSSGVAENTGIGQIFVDLVNQTTSGSTMMMRIDSPDLTSWTNVPFGQQIFGAAGTSSNHGSLAGYNDEVLAALRFDLVTVANGNRVLRMTSQSSREWNLVFQAQWAGRFPIRVGNVPLTATLSHGSIDGTSGDWLVDPVDGAALAFNPPLHFSGNTTVLLVGYNGSSDPLQVAVTRVADTPLLVTMDQSGDEDTPIDISTVLTATLVDTDTSEVLSVVELSGIAVDHTVSDGVNSFTATALTDTVNIAGWSLGALTYQGAQNANGLFPLGVRVASTDNDGFSPTTDSAEVTDTVTVTINAVNDEPVIVQPATDPAAITIVENMTAIIDVDTADVEDTLEISLTYGLSGVDAGLLSIDANGNLAFVVAPDFEVPADSGGDNIYDLTVTVTDTGGLTDSVTIAVAVSDAAEGPLVTVPAAVTGTEDSAIGLGITVDPQLSQGGSQLNLIGTEAGFRDAGAGAIPTNFTIPAGTMIVRLTGYGGNENGANAGSQEEYQGTTLVVNLENNTYAGHTFYIFNQGTASNDNYAFSGVPLGAASDSGTVTGDQDTALNSITVARSGNTLSIVETQSVMDQAYLVEYLTNNSSADFLGSVGTVLDPGVLTGTLTLPATASFAVISIQDGRGGLADTEEDKGIGRFVVDLDSGLVSGTIFAQTGRGGNFNAGYAFSGYDLSANVPILSSGATIVGDTTANGNTQPDWTITRSGNVLTLVRAATPGGIFSSLISAQSYARVAISSSAAALGAASTVGIYDDDLLGATSAFTLTVPGTAQGGNLTIAMYNINDANNDQENSGTAQIFVDLVNGTTSGSFLVMRSSIPDLVSWTDVPFGVRLIDSPNTTTNHAADTDFTDELPGVLQFDLVTMPNGARRLHASATTVTPESHFSRDYQLTLQVQWYGRKPINITNVPAGASLSNTFYNADVAAWQTDPVDAPAVAMTPPLHYAGNGIVLNVEYDGTTDPLQVNVTRVADAPLLVTTDQSGDEDIPFDISTVLTATLVDTDTSEVLSVVELSGIAVDHTVSDGVNSFTATALTDTVNIASWSLGALTYQGAQDANGLFLLGVRVASTDDDGFSPTTDSAATTDTVTVTINPINDLPVIVQPAADPAAITIPENTIAITDVNTLDVEGSEGNGTLTYTVSGPDAGSFAIDANGNLSFTTAPDFEAPGDVDADNVYSVTVMVADSGGLTDTVGIAVTVSDVADTPDLAVDVGAPTPDLVAGMTSSIPVTVSNLGLAAETGPITATVTLTNGLTAPASYSENGWSCTTSGVTVSCVNSGPLNAGGASSFALPVTPDESTIGTLPGPLAVTVAPTDVNPGNNGPTPVPITEPVARDAQIAVAKWVDNPNPVVGEQITFTIVVTNSGPSGAVNVAITDVVQSGFSYVATSIAGGDSQNESDPTGVGLLWTINSLPVSGTATVSFQATINPSGVYSNTAAIGGPGVTAVDPPGADGPTVVLLLGNAAPVITQPATDPALITIPENSTVVTDVNTTDDMGVEGNGTLTYTISGPDAGSFAIDANGNLSFTTAPDFEAPGDVDADNVYSVTVMVADSGGLTDTVALALAIQDDDEDGIPAEIEDQGPNNGDGNNDGIPDSTQENVATVPLTGTVGYVTAESAPSCPRITQIAHLSENELTEQDSRYDYPLGLLDIHLSCLTIGETGTITYYWHTTADLSGWSFRKFGPPTPGGSQPTYYNYPALFSQTMISGTPVALMVVNLTDGVSGDDTIADGTIVDPGGPVSNTAPSIIQPISDPAAVTIVENTLAITDVNATDLEDTLEISLTYGLSGVDAGLLSIDANGNLAFVVAPDFEAPADSGGDNIYDLTVTVTDTGGLTDSVTIAVAVSDAAEGPLVTVPAAVTGTEDSAIGLGITVDPQLSQGGSQLNLIGTEAGFRDAGAGATPTNFTIPAGTTIVRLTGYGGNENGANAGSQEEYQGTTLVVNLENNTYAGHTFYIFNQGTASNDNYAFSGVPLGAASDSGTVTGDQDTALNSITVARSGNTLSIVETQSVMDQAYLVEYLTNNSSADFLGSVGTVLDPGVLTGTLTLPATASFAVISIQDGRGGLADTEEDKGIGRFVVDLDSGLVSGTIFAQTGRGGNFNAGYAFSGYDLSANVPILSSGATIVGDTTANGNTQPDWTITRSGNVLTLVRAATPGGIFSSLISAQSYARVAISSSAAALGAASTVGIYDDDLLGATSAFTLTVPGTAQGGNLTIAMYNINDANNDQENSGTAQIFVDLVNGTTSGSFLVMRSSIPDLVSWTDVPFGVRLIDSPNTTTNHAADTDFTDELPGVLQFDLVTMPNGARRLRASATTVTPESHFSRDYQLTLQVQWYGRKPINFTNLPAGASLSDTIYDETAAAWQADPVDAPAVAMTPPLHYSGNGIVLNVEYDGTTDPLQVNVTRVADAPLLVTTDQSGDEDTSFDISTVLTATLVDTDTSEVLSVVELSGIAVDHTVSDGVNSFTATALTDTVNIASWSLGALTYQGAQDANGLFPLGVRVVSTDDDGFSPTTDSAATTDTVTVTINPINDLPVIVQPAADPAAITIPENTVAITDVNTLDVEGSEGNGTLTYTVSGPDAGSFAIDANGNLSFTTAPDFEAPGDVDADNVYSVTVMVADSGGLTDTVGIAVTVSDVADTPDLAVDVGAPTPDLVAGVTSSIPVTVSNLGLAAETGPITATVTLTNGLTAPASYSENGWSCTTSGVTVSCVNSGPLNAGGASSFALPVTPDESTIGTLPGPLAVTVAPTDVNPGNNGPTPVPITEPVARDAQIAVAKWVDNPNPVVGEQITFTIVVTNSGPSGAVNVAITDVVQSGFSYVATSIAGGDSQNESDPTGVGLLWTINSLPVSGTATVSFQATINPSGVYSNTAAIGGPGVTAVDPPGADGPTVVLLLGNAAPVITQPATDPALITIPENSTVVTDVNTTDDMGVEGNGTLTYTISGPDAGSFAIDANGNLSFTTAPDFEAPGDVDADNVYSVTVMVADSGGLTDTVGIAVTVSDVADTPDLAVDVGAPTPDLVAGVTSSIPVTVSNLGLAAETGPITATVTLTNGLTAPASYSENGWSCTTSGVTVSCVNSGPLNAGGASSFALPVTPDESTIGTLPGPLAVTVAPTDVNPGNNGPTPVPITEPVARDAQIAVAKWVDNPNPVVGEQITFTIVVTNSGPSGAVNVAITDVVQSGFSYVATSIAGGDSQNESDPTGVGLLWTINSLPVSGTATVSFQATVNPSGVYSNTAAVGGPGVTAVDPPGADGPTVVLLLGNAAPVITQPATDPALITIPENSTVVTDVNTTDDMGVEGNGTLTYTVSGPDAALFSIEETTGVLSFTTAPDFEAPADAGGDNTYDLVVTVTDNGGLTDSVTMAISVSDVADTPDLATAIGQPQPDLVEAMTSTVPVTVTNGGDAPATGPITTTVDLPTGVTAPASFSDNGWNCTTSGQSVSCLHPGPLVNGTESLFNVPVTPDSSTVGTTPGPFSVTTTPVAGEVMTADNGPVTMTPLTPVAAADVAPTITSSGTVTISENTTVVTTVTASGTTPITYSIVGGADAALFTINPTTGELSFVAAPDFEAPADGGGDNVYDLTVQASNSAGTDTLAMAVTVSDVADTPDLAVDVGAPTPDLVAGVSSSIPVTVSNLGLAAETGPITATVTLTNGLTAPASYSENGWSCTTSGVTVSCVNSGPLNAGGASSFALPVTPDESTIGTLPGPLAVTVAPTDVNPGNNGPTPVPITEPVARDAQIAVAKWVDNPNPVVGEQITFTIVVTNSGPSGAVNVAITDVVQSGFSYVATSIAGGDSQNESDPTGVGLLWTINSLPVSGTATVSFQATINPSGVYSNGVAVGGPGVTAVDPPGADGPTVVLTPGDPPDLIVPVKVLLAGAYQGDSGLMRDDLRTLPDFPLTSPYGGGESIDGALLSVSGADAVVDWVLVELRDSSVPTTVVASSAGLLQADGDVVGVDGSSLLTFTLVGGNYYVALHHRNHLAVMSGTALPLSSSTPLIDFSTMVDGASYGSNSQQQIGGLYALWMGDINGDNRVIAAGPENDQTDLLVAVLEHPANTAYNQNYIVTGYSDVDINLDGTIIAAGPDNDINLTLYSVMLHPDNTQSAANFVSETQVPIATP